MLWGGHGWANSAALTRGVRGPSCANNFQRQPAFGASNDWPFYFTNHASALITLILVSSRVRNSKFHHCFRGACWRHGRHDVHLFQRKKITKTRFLAHWETPLFWFWTCRWCRGPTMPSSRAERATSSSAAKRCGSCSKCTKKTRPRCSTSSTRILERFQFRLFLQVFFLIFGNFFVDRASRRLQSLRSSTSRTTWRRRLLTSMSGRGQKRYTIFWS